VVHFDRWWKPAVENQATDRAFRIGQQRNVLVHKFITRGTVEERIDAMIAEKRQLADEILSCDSEVNLTELPDDELLQLVRLDVTRATL
jgi:non-specific serine/threonine protein kinase